jgi:hypothetical protein
VADSARSELPDGHRMGRVVDVLVERPNGNGQPWSVARPTSHHCYGLRLLLPRWLETPVGERPRIRPRSDSAEAEVSGFLIAVEHDREAARSSLTHDVYAPVLSTLP